MINTPTIFHDEGFWVINAFTPHTFFSPPKHEVSFLHCSLCVEKSGLSSTKPYEDIKRSIASIFNENTELLCCICLTLASLSCPIQFFFVWLFFLSLSGENFIKSFLHRLASAVSSIAEKTKQNRTRKHEYSHIFARRERCNTCIYNCKNVTFQNMILNDGSVLSPLNNSWIHSLWRAASRSQTSDDSLCFMLRFKLIWAQQAWQVKGELWAPSGLTLSRAFISWWSVQKA